MLTLVPKRFLLCPGPAHSNPMCAQEATNVHDHGAQEEDRLARAKEHQQWKRQTPSALARKRVLEEEMALATANSEVA